MLISASVAHSVLHLSAEMGTSGANQCQLGWCNVRDGADQVANRKKKKKKVGTLVLCFGISALFLFYLPLKNYSFHIWKGTLGAGSSKQRWFCLYFFWRKPEWGGTGRIPALVPSVPPRKNWPLSLLWGGEYWTAMGSKALHWADQSAGLGLFQQLPMAQRAFSLTLQVPHHFSCYTV